MRILLTNDDGISAPGLVALYKAIAPLGEIHVVAPDRGQSATSHSITFGRSIAAVRHTQRNDDGSVLFEGLAVEGRPADCVKLAIAKLIPQPVDLVISGMNAGANIGINVFYSGTVAAAMEAGFLGIPALAVSLHLGGLSPIAWDHAARLAGGVIGQLLASPWQAHTVLNLNLPMLKHGESTKGLRVVPVSTSPLVDEYHRRTDDQGNHHFTPANGFAFHHTPPDSDVAALMAGYTTLTPLQFDPTHYQGLHEWGQRIGSN